jgi:hypothetical protein
MWKANANRVPGSEAIASALALLLFLALVLQAAEVLPPLVAAMPEREREAAAHNTESANRLPVEAARRSWMIAGYSGLPWNTPSMVEVSGAPGTDFRFGPVTWDSRPWKSPIFYGVRALTWSGAAPVGAMLDFTHTKAMARLDDEVTVEGTRDGAPLPPRARVRELFSELEFSHGHNMLTLNGLWRLPLASAVLRPYLGAGLGVSVPHTEIQRTPQSPETYEYQIAGPTVQGVAGVEIRLPRGLSLFLEYKFTYSAYWAPITGVKSRWLPVDLSRQIGNWRAGRQPSEGTLSTNLVSQMVIGGVGYRLETAGN